MPERRWTLLLLTLVVAEGFCGGCRLFRRGADGPVDEAPSQSPDGIGLEQAQAILRGSTRGILVAANGALSGQTALSNSLAAVQAAIDAGLPMVVLDVCETRDGVCVTNLDHALGPSPATRDSLSGLDYEQLRSQTEGRANGPIPTLTEVLTLTRGRVLVGLRLQTARLPNVVRTLETLRVADQAIVLVATNAQIRSARPYLQRDTPVMIGFEAPTPERLARIESTPPWPTIVQLGPQTLSPSNVARVHAMGARVMVHQRGILLVRIGSDLQPYHRMGVAVILTDWPRQLLREMRDINRQALTVGE